jgi:hypothetical protein
MLMLVGQFFQGELVKPELIFLEVFPYKVLV